MEAPDMKLTPIPQKRARSAGDSAKKSKRTAEKTSEGRRKRKKRSHTARHGSESGLTAGESSKALRSRPRRQKTSILDLPDWLLIDIFMLEMNFSFPRCSIWIGRALSHPYVLRRLIAAGFAGTWDVWFGCAAQEVSSYQCLPASTTHTWMGDRDRFGGDPKLQNDILAQRWLTLDRLLQAQQIWLDNQRKGVHTYYRVPLPLGMQATRSEAVRSVGFEGVVQIPGFSVKEQFEVEFKAAVTGMGVDALRSPLYPNMLEVHQATYFPDRLITGPWREDDLRLLFWLGRAGAVLSDNQSWELVVDGLRCMNRLARMYDPEDEDIDEIRNHVSKVVRLFEIFRIWNKVPHEAFEDYLSSHRLGWLLDVLVRRTRIGESLICS